MTEGSHRTQQLRERVLAQATIERREAEWLWQRAWLESQAEPWTVLRRARCTAAVLRGLTPEIWPESLLTGQFAEQPISPEQEADLQNWQSNQAAALSRVDGQRAHMAVDYEKLLRLGVVGLHAQIEELRGRLDVTRPEQMERDAFYRACLLCLDGLAAFSSRYATHARQLVAASSDAEQRQRLLQLADICDRVPLHPPRTFWEAVQCVHLVTFALCASQQMLLFQLGRPDRYLLPFYEADIQAGRITPEGAQELIDCLCLLLSAYTPRGLAVGFMVGGRDGSGRDVCNGLTRLMIESIAHTRLPYPGIGLCWTEDTPEEINQRVVELLGEGLTHPALFNDRVITDGMIQAGLPPAEGCLYQHSTCVEITPIASSNVYVASPYINLLQALHDVLYIPGLTPDRDKDGRVELPAGQPLPAWRSFDALLGAYLAHLDELIRAAVVEQNTLQMTRRYNGGFPLLSCLVNDCLSRGLDIDHGGARHNWVEPSFVGLANTIDALAAIDQLVFREGSLTLDALRQQLAEAHRDPALRLRLLNQCVKYGNDDDGVDQLADVIMHHVVEQCQRYETYLGGRFHPGCFCWVMHERLGSQTAASADGRLAMAALGDGSGPAQGRERRGPTAAILSATKWDHTPMLGGIAVNVRFSRSKRPADFHAGLLALIQTFMARRGFELQVNVVDGETLRQAQLRPEEYRDLVMRIGGYSDYFVGLSPRMQQELIERTEHCAL